MEDPHGLHHFWTRSVTSVLPLSLASPAERLYDLAAFNASCSLASSSWEREVFKILPPVPFRSSSTLSLSGVAFLTSTNRVELPGLSVADNSFMK
jgi:hypothetical protein